MPTQFTAGALRKHISDARLPWSTNPSLADNQPIPLHSLGGKVENLRRAGDIPALDFKQVLPERPSNGLLLERRIKLGFVPRSPLRVPQPGPLEKALPAPVAPAAWGWP